MLSYHECIPGSRGTKGLGKKKSLWAEKCELEPEGMVVSEVRHEYLGEYGKKLSNLVVFNFCLILKISLNLNPLNVHMFRNILNFLTYVKDD